VRKKMRGSFYNFGPDSYMREGEIDVFILDTVKHSTLVSKEQAAWCTIVLNFFETD
jgi:hypothetical protein